LALAVMQGLAANADNESTATTVHVLQQQLATVPVSMLESMGLALQTLTERSNTLEHQNKGLLAQLEAVKCELTALQASVRKQPAPVTDAMAYKNIRNGLDVVAKIENAAHQLGLTDRKVSFGASNTHGCPNIDVTVTGPASAVSHLKAWIAYWINGGEQPFRAK
jgi:hypothetical protein